MLRGFERDVMLCAYFPHIVFHAFWLKRKEKEKKCRKKKTEKRGIRKKKRNEKKRKKE